VGVVDKADGNGVVLPDPAREVALDASPPPPRGVWRALLQAYVLVAAATAAGLAYVDTLYWESTDPTAPGSLLGNAGHALPQLLTIFIATLLVGPDRFSAFIGALLWTSGKDEWRRRIRAIRSARLFRRVRWFLLGAVGAALTFYSVMVAHRLATQHAVLCSKETAAELTGQYGMHCHLQDDVALCRGELSHGQWLSLHEVQSWNDALRRPYVTLRDHKMPVLSSVSADLLLKISDALLYTSDHPDGAQNRDALKLLAAEVLKNESLEELLALPPDQRYAQGTLDTLSIVHYALFAEVMNTLRLDPRQWRDSWRRVIASSIGAQHIDAIWPQVEELTYRLETDEQACNRLVKGADILKFAYPRAFANLMFDHDTNLAVRLLDLAGKLTTKGCVPYQTKGFWYVWNLCVYGRSTALAQHPICVAMDGYRKTGKLFGHFCKQSILLDDALAAVRAQGWFACANGQRDFVDFLAAPAGAVGPAVDQAPPAVRH